MFQIFPSGSSRDITTEFYALSIPHSREYPKIHCERFCQRDGERRRRRKKKEERNTETEANYVGCIGPPRIPDKIVWGSNFQYIEDYQLIRWTMIRL